MQTNTQGVCQFGQILKCVVDQDSRKVGCLQVMWQVSVRILASRLMVKKTKKKHLTFGLHTWHNDPATVPPEQDLSQTNAAQWFG